METRRLYVCQPLSDQSDAGRVFCKAHYDGYDIGLARLEHVRAEVVERILERRWRNSATKRAITDFDAQRAK